MEGPVRGCARIILTSTHVLGERPARLLDPSTCVVLLGMSLATRRPRRVALPANIKGSAETRSRSATTSTFARTDPPIHVRPRDCPWAFSFFRDESEVLFGMALPLLIPVAIGLGIGLVVGRVTAPKRRSRRRTTQALPEERPDFPIPEDGPSIEEEGFMEDEPFLPEEGPFMEEEGFIPEATPLEGEDLCPPNTQWSEEAQACIQMATPAAAPPRGFASGRRHGGPHGRAPRSRFRRR